MDYNLSPELQQHLDKHERLLWTGQPKKGIIFRPYDTFMIPFSLVWCGFAIFWVFMAYQSSIFFALFGVPFVIIGLILVFGRFIFDARQRANIIYGITNERIIIRSGITKKSFRFLDIKTLSNIKYDEKEDGTGTISFGIDIPSMDKNNGLDFKQALKSATSFDLIPEAKQVYNKILEIQRTQ